MPVFAERILIYIFATLNYLKHEKMRKLLLLFLFAGLISTGCDSTSDADTDNNTPPTEQNPDDSDDPNAPDNGDENDPNDPDNPDDPNNPNDPNDPNDPDGGEEQPGEEIPPVEKVEDELPDLPFEYDWAIVAADGTGDYTTLTDALRKVSGNKYHVIHIRPGVYYEKINMNRNRVILYGDDPETTILTYDDFSGNIKSNGKETGTQDSYSFAVNAQEFVAINVTFQNTHVNKSGSGDQAVAVGVYQDRAAFYNCRLTGYQDTFYVKNEARVYCKDCYIEGNVDFIFGDAALLCENCTLCVNRNDSPITAPSTSPKNPFGFVFRDCRITSIDGNDFNDKPIEKIYLGRAWKSGARAVYINCEEPANLSPDGWRTPMEETVKVDGVDKKVPAEVALFAEYKCTGEGATEERLSQRKNNGRQLTDEEAAEYTRENIFMRSPAWDLIEPFSL